MSLSSILRVAGKCSSGANPLLTHQVRHLFRYLNPIFNHVEPKKIKELGPDVAASEWIIRNGGKVKFSNKEQEYHNNYDSLISDSNFRGLHLIEIDATEASITHHGFGHLKHLKHIKKIVLCKNQYLEDVALVELSSYSLPSLKTLEVISCQDITDTGVLALAKLTSLAHLKLENLLSVQDKARCLDELINNLEKCKIEWN